MMNTLHNNSSNSNNYQAPTILNPFRTQKQLLHHHQQQHAQRNHSNSNIIVEKDGFNLIWIDNPIVRVCYITGILFLLICLGLVGYEAYVQFPSYVNTVIASPHKLSFKDTATTMDPRFNAINIDTETMLLRGPEILHIPPPKIIAATTTTSNGIDTTTKSHKGINRVVRLDNDEPREQAKQKSPEKYHGGKLMTTAEQQNDEDVEDVQSDVHDTANTDDNVEHLIHPGEGHAKLLDTATKDMYQSELLLQQHQSSDIAQGFGDVVLKTSNLSKVDEEDHVVVLPRKSDALLLVDENNNANTVTTPRDKSGETSHTESILENSQQEQQDQKTNQLDVLPPQDKTTTIQQRQQKKLRHVVTIPSDIQ
jgi:hypothetical protein